MMELVVPTAYPVPAAKVKVTTSSGSTVVSEVGSMVRVAVLEFATKVTVPVVVLKVAAPVWA